MINLTDTLSASQVKKLLGISEATLHRLRNDRRKLHAIKNGGEALFDPDEVREVLRERIKAELLAQRNRKEEDPMTDICRCPWCSIERRIARLENHQRTQELLAKLTPAAWQHVECF
jgi:hypothetical protein